MPWKKYQRNVRRLQQRIYRAERRGDRKRARNLQRLLLRSWSARCLAVRQVTQENRGKCTAQRLKLAKRLHNLPSWKEAPIRRKYIPKSGTECLTCGLHFERRQHFSDPPLQQCPHGHRKVRRVFSPPTIVFNGPGFYVTDNRSGGSGGRSSPRGKVAEKEGAAN